MWLLIFLLACAAAAGIRLVHVHRESGEWRMRPSAEPPILRFNGHVYNRVGSGATKEIGFVKGVDDLGGGKIFAPRGAGVPETIQVRDRDLNRFYEYQLAG
jgi:hypothetical protein